MTTNTAPGAVERARTLALAVESGSPDFLGVNDGGCHTCWHRNPDGPELLAIIEQQAATIAERDERIEELETKLRMLISHASGGHLSEPDDINRSTNDIAVEISRHVNRVWEHAQESARKEDATTLERSKRP